MPENSQQFTHGDYTIGWICALPETELVAAAAMLDEEHPVLPAADPRDTNSYILGSIRDHNVVIACLPAETTGKVSAATVAKDMLRSFPAVRFGLMVGIGGGAPYYGAQCDNDAKCSGNEEEDSEDDLEEIRDIRLGDVVISLHSKSTEAVVQYDFGKSLHEKQFIHTGGKLNKPPGVVLGAVAILQQLHKRKGNKISELLIEALRNNPGMGESFEYPKKAKDRLFKSGIVHMEDRKSCKACCGPNNTNLVKRPDRDTSAPRIHYGTIGSADQVMKDAVLRDQWAQKEGIICFEMEAAGLMDSFPCLVIRGICDYADSHKNKSWQSYAAATAASYAKELLLVMPGQNIASLLPIKQISNQLAKIEESTTEIKRAVLLSQDEQFRDEVLSWLSPLDYNAKLNDIFTRHTPGTGTWLLNTSSFSTWIETPGQTLYCPGIPGAGKTVLASIVIEHLRQMPCDKNAATAFLFCTYNEHWKAEDLIACLLKQFTCQIPSLPDEVRKLYDRYRAQKTVPRKNDLIETLVSITNKFSRVFVVVDAIDECQDDSRADFIDAIMNIKPPANILVTSRPITHIKESLHCDLEEPIRAIEKDITTYIEAEIASQSFILSSDLSRRPELRSRLVTQIVASAKEMFLHAQFHVKHLAPKHNIRDLREALEDLPKTSEKIYEEAMKRVQSQKKDTVALAMKTLLCVVGAARPLHIQEIQHALAVRETDQYIDDEALTAPTHLLSICAGLLTIDGESNIIRLVHYTAQEYFKDNEVKYFSNAQAEIASICLKYLSLEVFSQGYCSTDKQYENRTKTYVLLEYAAENLGKHISGEIGDKVIHSAVMFLSDKGKVSSAIQAAFIQMQSYGRDIQKFPKRFYGIHYASYLGWADVVNQFLVSYENKVDLRDINGRTPLSWAAEYGHKAVLKLLLDTGEVDVDSKDQSGQTPLSWAAEYGHKAVVKLLLDTGKVDVDSKDESGRTPLSWAAWNGQEAVVKLLLDTGKVDVDSKDESGRTPLSWAARNGQEGVVKLLLDTGEVDVDSKDESGRTPLSWAAWNGNKAVLKLLLDTGKVDMDSKDESDRTPLSRAAWIGHEAVLKLLLDTGKVNVDLKDHSGRTPLSWAAWNGQEAAVKLLLDTGKVDVDSKDGFGRTPLSRAAENGHEAAVKLLLDTGEVDMDSKDKYGQTPLSWAAKYGHEGVVTLLTPA